MNYKFRLQRIIDSLEDEDRGFRRLILPNVFNDPLNNSRQQVVNVSRLVSGFYVQLRKNRAGKIYYDPYGTGELERRT